MRWAPAIVAVVAAGCLQPALVECPNDLLCPAGDVCDTVHGGCITPGQKEVCAGVSDRERCAAGPVIGYCLDQICIDPGCGNFIVEAGELCDDGNRDDGDGCSETCLSREACGDGFLSTDLGEECDDGSLQSHDGCDSRCLIETAAWTYDEIGPKGGEQSWTAFDETRGKTVIVMNGYVWGWTGARWTVLSSDAPNLGSDYDIVFDRTRGTLLAIIAEPQMDDIVFPNPIRDLLYEWDGTTWVSAVTTNAPAVATAALTYDTVRQRVFLFGLTATGGLVTAQLDVATKQWAAVTPPVAPLGIDQGLAIAFDENRGRVVVVSPGSSAPSRNPTVLEWSGGPWVSTQIPMASVRGWSLIYDRVAQRVVALGGPKSMTTSAAQAWNGAAWMSFPDIPGSRLYPSATFDTVRQRRVVFGGADQGERDDVLEGSGAAWTPIARIAPPTEVVTACAFDEPRRRLVCTGPKTEATGALASETWAWTGTWNPLPTQWPGEPPTAVTFDPVRGTVVGVGRTGLVALVNDDWTVITAANPLFERSASIVFDPSTQDLVAVMTPEFGGDISLVRIAQDNTVQSFPSVNYQSLGYDARNHVVVGIGFGTTAQLNNGTWSSIVGPGTGYVVATNARRGTVEFLAPGVHAVERVGSAWIDHPDVPPIRILGTSTFDQTSGELSVIGANGGSRFMLHRRWQSATPFETCGAADDDDADGDGLAGCADPDCWSTCTPACPPLTNCL